jgi:hypothetical protein
MIVIARAARLPTSCLAAVPLTAGAAALPASKTVAQPRSTARSSAPVATTNSSERIEALIARMTEGAGGDSLFDRGDRARPDRGSQSLRYIECSTGGALLILPAIPYCHATTVTLIGRLAECGIAVNRSFASAISAGPCLT